MISQDEVRVDLYARNQMWLEAAIEKEDLQAVVRVTGVMPRDDVMAAERRANRLLVLLWDGENAEGIVTGKLFEYLGARRPVLAIGGPERSAVDEVLTETGAGERVRALEPLKAAVLAAVQEHRARAVPIVSAERLVPFEASTMAASFARLLDRVVHAEHVASPTL